MQNMSLVPVHSKATQIGIVMVQARC